MELNMKQKSVLNISNLLLLLAVLVAVNVLSTRFFYRFDVSEGEIFTLSDYSRQVVADLKDPVTVKAYFSRNLGQYNNVRQHVKDKLADYRSYSHGKFSFELIDPGEDEQLKQEAAGYGVQPIQMQTLEDDKLEVKLVWMGLVFLYGDKKEIMPTIPQINNLEYDFTSLLKRLTAAAPTRIGILQGHGEPLPDDQLAFLTEMLSKNYYIEPVDLTKVHHIDTGLQALLLISPTENYSPAALALLDEYFMYGGRLGIFTNNVETNMQNQQGSLQGSLRNHGLHELLSAWGVSIQDNLVMDQQCGKAPTSSGGRGIFSMFSVMMHYPHFPRVTGFNSDMSISKGVEIVQLFYPSSLDTSVATHTGVKVEPFVWSSPHTQEMKGRFQLGIQQQYSPADFPDGRQIFGAAYSGSFPAGRHDAGLLDSLGINLLPASPENRLAVCGDGNFINNIFLTKFLRTEQQRIMANLGFAQNIVDWLVQDEGLINIRSKVVVERPLRETTAGTRTFIKWLNILGAPVILVGFGIVRWQMKRNRRKQEL